MGRWQRQIRRRAAVGGILAFALVVLLLATIFVRQFLRGQPPTHPLVVLFPQGADFRPGSPVWMAGYRVGVVWGVDFVAAGDVPDAHYALNVAVDTAYWDFLRADSEASAARPRLLQRVVVLEILPGSASSPLLHPGDTLRARPPVKLDRLADQARAIRPGLDSLLADGRTLEQTVRGRGAQLSELENELERAGSELDRLSAGFRDGTLYRLMEDRVVHHRLERIRASAQEIAAAVADRSVRLQPAAERIGRRAELVIASISEIQTLVQDRRGSLPRAVDDAAIEQAIERMRAQIDSLVSQLRRQPLGSLF